jgi:pimeloyl-ACP methyl ester carboxylesterase
LRLQIVKSLTSATPGSPIETLGDKPKADIRGNRELQIQAVPELAGPAIFPDPAPDLGAKVFEVYQKRGWGQVSWGFYGPILKDLQLKLNPSRKFPIRHPVWVHGYDWRQSNQDSGDKLVQKIAKVLKEHPTAKQVVIVTHSMGGLVCRSALLDGALPNVAGVVHTVQPSCGTPVAYRRFHSGATPTSLDGPGPDGKVLDWVASIFLAAIQGIRPREYAITQSGLRGPLQLLPSNDYPEMFLQMLLDDLATDNLEVVGGNSSTRFDDLYDVYALGKSPGIVPEPFSFLRRVAEGDLVTDEHTKRLRANLDRARKFHQRFRDPSVGNCHPLTFSLFGRGKRTDIFYDDIPLGLTPQARTLQGVSGDGTVAEASSQFRNARPPAQKTTAFPVEHAACFSNPDFNKEVLACVNQIIAKAKK